MRADLLAVTAIIAAIALAVAGGGCIGIIDWGDPGEGGRPIAWGGENGD